MVGGDDKYHAVRVAHAPLVVRDQAAEAGHAAQGPARARLLPAQRNRQSAGHEDQIEGPLTGPLVRKVEPVATDELEGWRGQHVSLPTPDPR